MTNHALYSENVPGPFYVHDSCIACDTCTDMAPLHFSLTPNYDHAYVHRQPTTDAAIQQCQDACDACPVGAIGRRQ